ncbi:hypothetical protein CP8484711_2609, partial [Chlamydia psittaci 84-8471/1]
MPGLATTGQDRLEHSRLIQARQGPAYQDPAKQDKKYPGRKGQAMAASARC